jgi:hypothetical protein
MDNRKRPFVLLVCISLCAVLAGCSNEPRQYEVQGSVTYQGQPITDGQILFEDEGGSGRWPGTIRNGQYQLKATAGPKLVRLTATKETGRMLEGAMDTKVPERVEIIPAKYNQQSQERRTVEAKSQEINFELQ